MTLKFNVSHQFISTMHSFMCALYTKYNRQVETRTYRFCQLSNAIIERFHCIELIRRNVTVDEAVEAKTY